MAKRGLDYYGILGLTKSATDSQIKEAYRHLSLQYNPVRNKDPNLEDLFCLVGEAYEVLTNPLLKSIYDQYGEAGMKKGVLTPVGWHAAWVYHGEPLRTFKKFFGTANPYADLMYCMRDQIAVFKADKLEEVKVKEKPFEKDLELTLEEVYNGTMKKFKIQRQVYDEDRITTHVQEKILCVNIKPGLPSGSRIVFQGVGDEGPAISPGDLVLITKDIPHDKFKRSGVNLHMDVTLDLHQCLEKLVVELNTLDDRIIRFAITDFIVAGYVKVVHGEGMPYVDDVSKKGDLIITFDVIMPKYLDDKKRMKLLNILLKDEEDKESPEILFKLWMASKLKTNYIPPKTLILSLKKEKIMAEEEEGVAEEEGKQVSEVEPCINVEINKERLYKLYLTFFFSINCKHFGYYNYL